MAKESIYDIVENEVEIKGKPWNDQLIQRLVWKQIYITQRMIDYWRPYLDRGERLFEMYDGEILTDEQRSIYEEIEHKITIEPPIMKSPIRALLAQAIKAIKSGAIGVEKGDLDNPGPNPVEIETVDICLKYLEKKNKERIKIRDAIHDSMVSCYPNVLFFQQRKPTFDNPLKYGLNHPTWNSCVFGPINPIEPDLSDINELVYMHPYSMGQLINMYPHMEDTITAHWHSEKMDDKQLAGIMQWDNGSIIDASETSYLNSIYNAAYGNLKAPSGLMPTFMRLFPIKTKEDVFVNVNPDDEDDEDSLHVILPEKWSDRRKEAWAEKNKDKYEGPYEKETIVLWQCVYTSSGLLLSNKKHWYQECGNLPAAVIVPCLINGKPSGPSVDMSQETLGNCVAQIEFLDDMRKGSGQLFVFREGALTQESTENIVEQSNMAAGVVYVNKDFQQSLNDAYKVEKREPTRAWHDYGEFQKQQMNENTRINESMQGESAPRQSGIAKTTEIGQAMTVSALYFDNLNLQWENLQNLKLSLIRYCYDRSFMIVDSYDEKGDVTKTTTVNVPKYDMNGDVEAVYNDVTSNRYRWMISPVDDSPSAKSRYMQDALMIINASAGPLMQSDPTGKLVSSFWAALDNPILNEAGRRLSEDMQLQQQNMSEQAKQEALQEAQVEMIKAMSEMERAKKSGLSLSFTGEQIAKYPNLMTFYQSLKQQAESSAAQPASPQPQTQKPEPPSPQGSSPTQQPPTASPDLQGSGVPSSEAVPAAAVA